MIIENCQLEIDTNRGVIYVHNKENGITVLRICGLKIDDVRPEYRGTLLDINAQGSKCNWT